MGPYVAQSCGMDLATALKPVGFFCFLGSRIMWWVRTVHGEYVNLELAGRVFAHPEEGGPFFAAVEVGESRHYLGGGMTKTEACALIDKVFDSVKQDMSIYDLTWG
jgi:hypothetical protein